MAEAPQLNKRVCLFTGASGRLGTAFCRQFAGEYTIAAVYRNRVPSVTSQLQWVVDPLAPAEQLEENRNPVFALRADLTGQGEVDRVVEVTLARFGRIDLLVNAAAHSCWSPILESSELVSSVGAQLTLNVEIPLKLAASVARQYWRDRDDENRQANRNIVNISSIAGLCVYPGAGQSVYSASKAALNMMTCHIADDFGAIGVRANALAPNSFPGRVRTEHVAAAILQLDRCDQSGCIVAMDSDGAWSYWPDAENMQRHRGVSGRRWSWEGTDGGTRRGRAR